jgi:hypothetical protein
MACRVRCETSPIVAEGDTCIDVSGTGISGDPLQISAIIPAGAVVPHPLAPGFLPDTINGLACTLTGLMAPQPGFPAGADGNLPFGSNPDIIANTGGQIPWGPVLSISMTNLNSDRLLLFRNFIQHPFCTMVLEPGAVGTIGAIFDPLGLAIYLPLWKVSNNSGAAVETYGAYPQTFVGGGNVVLPAAAALLDGQMWVELSGATGASSITTIGQAGMVLGMLGVPI